MAKEYFDILIVVPLEEELHEVNKHFYQIEDRSTHETLVTVVDSGNNELRVLCTLQEQEGRMYAQKAASAAFEKYDVGIVICLGIAGCLTDDLRLGDVIYTGHVIDILDGAKVTDRDGQIELEFSPVHYETAREITQAINLTRTLSAFKPLHQKWADERENIATSTITEPFPGRNGKVESVGRPRSKNGKIICGDVSKSEIYNKKLDGIDRKFLGIETESGGIFAAAKQAKVAALTIRGLSDHADKQKNKLESETGGRIRELAAGNASTFLRMQLQNERFVFQLKSLRDARLGSSDGSARVAPPLPLDDLQSIVRDLQSVINDRLGEVSLELRHRERGYRLPVPRVRPIAEVGAIEVAPNQADAEFLDAVKEGHNLSVSMPKGYPDIGLAWILADYLISAPIDEVQYLPLVIEGSDLRVPSKGIASLVPLDLLDRGKKSRIGKDNTDYRQPTPPIANP